MTPHARRGRGLLALALTLAMGVPLVAAAPVAAASEAEPPPAEALAAKADRTVEQQLTANDTVTFWVRLDSEADTSAAKQQRSKADKGRVVYEAKSEHAARTQAGLRALLRKAGAPHKTFWISNTLKVTGDKALAEKIAARAEVASIRADVPVELPEPKPGTEQATVNGIEWGLDAINAPQVWDELGVHGEGIVIANIDTGVEYQHPALLGSYRGQNSDGTVSHSYNWFDATGSCPDNAPCDEHGHGTHTMGTMVGDDGAGNRIGVAPGATWIAAKACTTLGCPQSALLAAGQWILAPTDSNGSNPRPELAPHVVNNSWGADIVDTWYKTMVQAWRDAGIFPAFSNGNAGPDCDTAGSPGAYTNSYASGAFDINGNIAGFSSRGSGEEGAVKPDLAAPGVDIRSSVPGGGYAPNSGTSMASPHTAATVALMWSASPAIRGDIAATELLLDRSATDTDDTSCGGTAANNNVFGEGKLDAYAAVNGTPRGPLGALTGNVTAEGDPLAGATVQLEGPMYAQATTGQDGTYKLPKVMVGDYTVTVSKYGYLSGRTTATVAEGRTTIRNLTLAVAPVGTVTGTVSTAGGPESGATITVAGTPVTVTSGPDGGYTLELPAGSYRLTVTPVSRCAAVGAFAVEVAEGANSKDLALPSRTDKFGTTCRVEHGAGFPTGDAKLNLYSNYSGAAEIKLPFPVALYGRTYREATVNTEGYLTFETNVNNSTNHSLPYSGYPNGALFPFWDNLQRAGDGGDIYWSTRGTAPHREVVVEWRDMVTSSARTHHLDFSVVISEDGEFSYHYRGVDGSGVERGSGATIGVENADGSDALQFSHDEASIADGMGLVFRPGRHAAVSGTVTDANDGKPVAGATVTVTRDGEEVATGKSGGDGSYLVQVPATHEAEYDITVSAPHYTSATRTATLSARSASRADTALATGLLTVDPSSTLTVTVPADQSRERPLSLANSGSAPTDYTVTEASGAGWLTVTPAAGHLGEGGEQQVELTFDTTGVEPGTVLSGTVVVASDSGREPRLELPVEVLVPAYRAAVDAGSDEQVLDGNGDTWGVDREYEAGSYGYLGHVGRSSTKKTVDGTQDQQLYGTARQGALEYRFDDLPDGVYQVDLGFAELSGTKPGQRVFDVMAEGSVKIADLDIVKQAGGNYRAMAETFTVEVTDGRLNLRLVSQKGKTLINAVRVTERPDLSS